MFLLLATSLTPTSPSVLVPNQTQVHVPNPGKRRLRVTWSLSRPFEVSGRLRLRTSTITSLFQPISSDLSRPPSVLLLPFIKFFAHGKGIWAYSYFLPVINPTMWKLRLKGYELMANYNLNTFRPTTRETYKNLKKFLVLWEGRSSEVPLFSFVPFSFPIILCQYSHIQSHLRLILCHLLYHSQEVAAQFDSVESAVSEGFLVAAVVRADVSHIHRMYIQQVLWRIQPHSNQKLGFGISATK